MDISHYLVVAVILAAGGMLQSAAGFGYALLSVTLLLLTGMEPYEAIATVTVATTIQSITGIWYQRQDVPWRLVGVATLLLLISVPVGVFLLGQLTSFGPQQVQRVFGAVVLLIVLVYAIWRPQPREHVHPAWTVAAMLSAGILAGLCGMAGPPVVLWAITHQWSSQRIRATLWTIFLAMTPLGVFFLYQRFGHAVLQASLLALVLVPAVLAGTFAGIWVGNRIPQTMLRRLAIALLVILGVYLVWQPM